MTIKIFKKTPKYNSIFQPQWTNLSKPFVEQIANNLAARLLDSTSSKKTFDRWVSLSMPAWTSNSNPPIGPFLGQHGFSAVTFSNNFNTLTKHYPEATPLKVVIKLFTDKTFQFQVKTPSVSYLLYSAYSNNDFQGVTFNDLLKIILIKRIDHFELSNFSLLASIIGTLRSAKYKIITANF